MTKRVFNIFILLLLIVSFFIVFIVFSRVLKNSNLTNSRELSDRFVLNLDKASIKSILSRPRMGHDFTIERSIKKIGDWGVMGFDYPLDPVKIERFFDVFSHLELYPLHDAQENLDIYGLSFPNLVIEVILFSNEKKVIKFGKNSVIGEKVYVSIEGDSRVYYLAEEERTKILDNLNDYWNLSLPSFDWSNISYLKLNNLEGVLEIENKKIKEDFLKYIFIKPFQYKDLVLNLKNYEHLWELWIKEPFFRKGLKVGVDSWSKQGLDSPVFEFFLKDKIGNKLSFRVGNLIKNSNRNYYFVRLNDENAVFEVDEKYLKDFLNLKAWDLLDKQIVNVNESDFSYFVLESNKIQGFMFIGQFIDSEKIQENPFIWNDFLTYQRYKYKSKNFDNSIQTDSDSYKKGFEYKVNGSFVDSFSFIDFYTKLKSLSYNKDVLIQKISIENQNPFLKIIFYNDSSKIEKKIEFYLHELENLSISIDGVFLDFLVSYKEFIILINSINIMLNVVTKNF